MYLSFYLYIFYHLLPLYLLTYLLPVIPASVVHPLAQELNGRLGTVRLQHGHVKVINKEDEVFSQWRTKYTLPSEKKTITVTIMKLLDSNVFSCSECCILNQTNRSQQILFQNCSIAENSVKQTSYPACCRCSLVSGWQRCGQRT